MSELISGQKRWQGLGGIEIAGSKGRSGLFTLSTSTSKSWLRPTMYTFMSRAAGRAYSAAAAYVLRLAAPTVGMAKRVSEGMQGATDHRVWPTEAPQHAERPCDVEGPRGLDICGLGSCGLNVAVVDKRCSLCPLVDAAGDSGLQSKPRSQGKRGA